MSLKNHSYYKDLPSNKYNPFSWICEGAKIGKNCWIGAFVYIADNVEIGNNVSISNGVQIFDHDTSLHRATEGRLPVDKYKIKIGDFTQIGANSVILPGSEDILIGHHCIIGAKSLVKSNIPNLAIAYGSPARINGRVDLI